MDTVWPSLFLSLLAAVISALLVWYLTHRWRDNTRQQCERLLFYTKKEAEISSREILNEAQLRVDKKWAELERHRDRFELERDHDREEIVKERRKLREANERIEDMRQKLSREEESLRNMTQEYRRQLQDISCLSEEKAAELLRYEVSRECQDELRHLRRTLLDKSEKTVRSEARKVLISSMQRLTTRPLHDVSATLVSIPGEDMKGRIIGREGRNIKCFEALTGVTLMIDESPNSVLISSFDPVRREIARAGLQYLIEDGRIHPTSIEEFVKQAEGEIEEEIVRYGDEAVEELRLVGIHPEVRTVLGRLKYRYSYTQNVLEHSIEVAFICSMLASELGLDPVAAKRAGLLHDIGKAIDHTQEGSHALVGAEFLRRHGEDSVVVNAVAAHHEEVKAESLIAGLVMVGDALSSTRPGVRKEPESAYIDRLQQLEELAGGMKGVKDAYALQAGREIRVVVEPAELTDEEAGELSRQLRHRIENNLQYPGSIRVTVIRERRFSETAT